MKLILALLLCFASPALAQMTPSGGAIIEGTIGSGPRPDGQVLISNEHTGGHTIVTLANYLAHEEAAFEGVGVLSNGHYQQQGAQFWRFVNGNNTAVPFGSDPGFESSWSMHLTKYGTDNTPIVLFGRNSLILCGGYTPLLPWEGMGLPPASWVDTRCGQSVRGSLNVGPDLSFSANYGVRLTVQERAEIGMLNSAGNIERALQLGYSSGGDTAYVQGYNPQLGQFLKLAVAGSEIQLGYSGHKVGFMGAAPVARPTVTCSVSAGNCFSAFAAALAALGLINNAVSP